MSGNRRSDKILWIWQGWGHWIWKVSRRRRNDQILWIREFSFFVTDIQTDCFYYIWIISFIIIIFIIIIFIIIIFNIIVIVIVTCIAPPPDSSAIIVFLKNMARVGSSSYFVFVIDFVFACVFVIVSQMLMSQLWRTTESEDKELEFCNSMQSQLIQFFNRITLKRDQLCYPGFAQRGKWMIAANSCFAVKRWC